jgi:hypothetical protein
MHDWTRVPPGVYHDFHQGWTIEIRNRLNSGVLPDGSYAMADQRVGGPEPDVVTLGPRGAEAKGGAIVAEAPPRLKQAARSPSEAALYAMKANRLAIRYRRLDRVVAIIEVVSLENKDTKSAVSAFVSRAVEFLRNGIHFLMVDPYPPGRHDSEGMAQAVWDELVGEPLESGREEKPCIVAAFDAGDPITAYVGSVSVSEPLPDAPLFLAPGWYVNVPLEETYQTSWAVTPRQIREEVETPATEESPEAQTR